ncbi:MAG: non-canonical purine NTP diphosphatase [Bacteroidota bacterium]|nr:non-canonical purine NTP diphosphatase [Bacteroidota bacterium]
MRKILFATHNKNKIKEVDKILGDNYNIVSLYDIDFHNEIPETQNTIEGNASQKTNYIFEIKAIDCFADDTGLEVEYLNGDPGVYSARYAGEQKNDKDNVAKLLKAMEGVSHRNARFKTVISLIFSNKEYIFEGIAQGKIAETPRGNSGFGYDPVFIPEGYTKTFAQLSPDEKNTISHRALAVKKLTEFLSNQ